MQIWKQLLVAAEYALVINKVLQAALEGIGNVYACVRDLLLRSAFFPPQISASYTRERACLLSSRDKYLGKG